MRLARLTSVVLALSACGPSITVDRDPSIPIPAGSTYSWTEPGPRELRGERNPTVNNALVQDRIHGAVDREMTARGYRLVPSGGDFLVHYHVGLQRRRDTLVTAQPPLGPRRVIRCGVAGCWDDWNWDYWGYWGPPELMLREVSYFEGALLIDLIQRSSGKLAWRGVGRDRVDEPNVSQKAIDKAVAAILGKLPAIR